MSRIGFPFEKRHGKLIFTTVAVTRTMARSISTFASAEIIATIPKLNEGMVYGMIIDGVS
jgi:hypothetical protein